MQRERAESAPPLPSFHNGRRLTFVESRRPERQAPPARTGTSRSVGGLGLGGHAINDGTRATTTGGIDQRNARKPAFPPLRKYSTSDHIDTSVLDPDADAEEDEDIADDEEEENDGDDEEDTEREDQGARQRRRTSSSTEESSSLQTLAEREQEEAHARAEKRPPKTEGQKLDASQAEKGEAGLRRRTRTRTGTGLSTSSASRKNPETRAWKDNIVTFDSPDDPANPKNWPYRRKVFITMLMGLTTMCSTFASSVFSPALDFVAREYRISPEVAILGLSLFIVGFVPGPIIFAPLSEVYGRKWPTLAPLFVSACFAAATATAENIQTIMITRFFAGVFASAPVTNVGGGLADMWDQRQRATAVVFYSLAVVAGPNLGSIVGAAFSQSHLGWRWTEYFTVILTCSVLALDLLFFPETFAPVILNAKARNLRWKTGRWELHSKSEMNPVGLNIFLHKHLILPLKMIVMEPMVLCITLFNSFAYGVSYLLFAAIPIIYEQNRGWSTLVGTLPFIALLLGSFTAAGINVLYSEKVFSKRMKKYGVVDPEWRLPPMMLGSLFFPIGFFILGWTSDPSIQWFPSVLGLYFVGVSFLLIFQGGLNYLLDAYTASAASAVAANTFLRSAAAGALPLVARPMYNNLGIPWACSLLGFICIAFAGIPVLFFKYGPRLRAMSRLARK
ncbi:MFS general substrate transporter [Cystobasidium minutum MCA 4210]|uniref:MFS general substrate transporter n=1 Tax=Cystobasidium minutum MCA 4210 TaxID=1397322 RepID=UPI0034CD679D|eukprot:jgi/Rhomi1/174134/fgenesh1_kg.7_\